MLVNGRNQGDDMLNILKRWARRLDRRSPTFSEIRQETYWLGSRHKGNVLEGALLELKALDANSQRADLLRAIILKERTA